MRGEEKDWGLMEGGGGGGYRDHEFMSIKQFHGLQNIDFETSEP